jgi:hypothetical protein
MPTDGQLDVDGPVANRDAGATSNVSAGKEVEAGPAHRLAGGSTDQAPDTENPSACRPH